MTKENGSYQKFVENNDKYLTRTTKEINKNFRIKVSGTYDGNSYHNYVGVSGLIKIIGLHHVNNFVDRAFNCPEDKCTCRLRSGLKIEFHAR